MSAQKSLNFLYLEDSLPDFEIITKLLLDAEFDFNISRVDNEPDFAASLRKNSYDIILADYNLPQFDAFGALHLRNELCPDVPFICVSGSIGEEKAIELLQSGASDYVLKDRPRRLPAAVRRAINETKEKEARRKAETDKRKKDEQHRLILQTAISGFWMLDKNGCFLEVNKAYCNMSGYTEEELLTMKISDVEAHEKAEETTSRFQKIMEKGEGRFESVHRRKDGSLFNVEINVQYKPFDEIWFVVFVNDITKRKQAELFKQNSLDQYRMLIDLAVDAFFQGNKSGNLILTNKAATELTGYSQQELLTMNIADLFPERQLIEKPLNYAALDKGEKITIQRELVRKDGTVLFIEMNSRKMNDGTYQSFFRNITERKQMEEELRNSRTELVEYFENDISADYLVSEEGEIYSCNQTFLNLFGFNSKENLHQFNITSLFKNPQDRMEMIKRIKKERKVENYEVCFISRDKKIIHALLNAIGKFDEVGRLKQIRGYIVDITERKHAEKALQYEKFLLHTLMDYSPDVIFFKDTKSRFVRVNKAMAGKCGLIDPDEVLGKTDFDLFSSEHSLVAFRDEQEIMRTGNPVVNKEEFETWIDGKITWSLTTKLPWFDSTGKVIGTFGHSKDITDRKKAENALKHSETQLTNALKMAHMGAWEYDALNDIFLFNDLFYDIFMTTADQVGGYAISTAEYANRFVHPEDRLMVGLEIRAALETDDPEFSRQIEHRIVYADGETGYVNIRFSIDKDKNGKTIRTYGVTQDITKRKEAELELIKAKEKAEESEASLLKHNEMFSILVENLTQGVFMVEAPGGKPILANKAAKKILGRGILPDASMNNLGEVYKAYKADTMQPYPLEEMPIVQGMMGNKKYIDDMVIEQPDGLMVNIEIFGTPVADNLGRIWASLVSFSDITERIKAQNEIIKAKEKAEESDRLKSAFLANMSHEIRTPMNGILGFTDLLLNPDLNSDEKENFIKIIHQSGQRMLNTVNDIVEISKIEAGMVNVIGKDTDVTQRLEELTYFFKTEAEKKGLKLILETLLPVQREKIITDQNKLDSILTNLIKNAIKYTCKGTIKIGCQLKGTEVEFYIKDSGIGIPANRLEAVFNRFEQAGNAGNRVFEGSGLGLAISKSYVEMLGGKIWVESVEEVGSTFYFTLPAKQTLEEVLISDKKISAINKKEKSTSKGLKILIAEDDEISRQYLSILFHDYANEIIEAKTGHEAVELCRNNKAPDIILMDIQMPGLNGYEATRRIREFNKEVVIIVQTAYALSGDLEKAIEAGCNDYIAKPIKKEILIRLIEKYYSKIKNT